MVGRGWQGLMIVCQRDKGISLFHIKLRIQDWSEIPNTLPSAISAIHALEPWYLRTRIIGGIFWFDEDLKWNLNHGGVARMILYFAIVPPPGRSITSVLAQTTLFPEISSFTLNLGPMSLVIL